MTKEDTRLAVILTNLEYIKADIAEIKSRLEKDYVTRSEFTPIKNLAYGSVGIIGTTVLAAILKLIILK